MLPIHYQTYEKYLLRCEVHLSIVECSTVQYSLAVEKEEESSRPCVECEVPRELLLHMSELIPPLLWLI